MCNVCKIVVIIQIFYRRAASMHCHSINACSDTSRSVTIFRTNLSSEFGSTSRCSIVANRDCLLGLAADFRRSHSSLRECLHIVKLCFLPRANDQTCYLFPDGHMRSSNTNLLPDNRAWQVNVCQYCDGAWIEWFLDRIRTSSLRFPNWFSKTERGFVCVPSNIIFSSWKMLLQHK